MELNYGAQLTPWLTAKPNLQYIINPDQSAEPTRTKNIPNAFVIGLKFTVDLAKLANLAPPS
jgi:porin